MVSSDAVAGNDVAVEAGTQDAPFLLRPYQAEMVEESLKSNIIWYGSTKSPLECRLIIMQ